MDGGERESSIYLFITGFVFIYLRNFWKIRPIKLSELLVQENIDKKHKFFSILPYTIDILLLFLSAFHDLYPSGKSFQDCQSIKNFILMAIR